jgi:hypothetical protein
LWVLGGELGGRVGGEEGRRVGERGRGKVRGEGFRCRYGLAIGRVYVIEGKGACEGRRVRVTRGGSGTPRGEGEGRGRREEGTGMWR